MANYISALTGAAMDDALQQMNNRVPEGWAVGERDGVPVGEESLYYHNNAKYYAEQAQAQAESAEQSAESASQVAQETADAVIAQAFVQESAEVGSIVTIDDGADNIPLKDLAVNLDIVQPGTGDPSPTNVRPIYPVTEAEVSRTGTNIWDEEWELGGYNSSGATQAYNDRIRSKSDDYIPIYPNTEYYAKVGNNAVSFKFYDKNRTFLSVTNLNNGSGTFTTPATARFMRFNVGASYGAVYKNDISINYPSTDHDYHSGKGNATTLVDIGINQWDEDWEVGGLNDDGTPLTRTDRIRSKNFSACSPNAEYYALIGNLEGNALKFCWYDSAQTFISTGTPNATTHLITSPSNARYFKIATGATYGTSYLNDISVNFPARFTSYYPYTGNVVYGGDADITPGALTSKYAAADMGDLIWVYDSSNSRFQTDSLTATIKRPTVWGGDAICSVYAIDNGNPTDKHFNIYSTGRVYVKDTDYTTVAAFTAAVTGQTLVYPLATPVSIQLDPTEVDTLRGDNVIWADCGDITNCEYRADLKLYIDKVVG